MLSADENEIFAFAIEYEGQVVGSISVLRQDDIYRRSAELGYYLGYSYWGKGIIE